MSLLSSSSYDIATLSQLEAVAQDLATSLQPGDVLALSGPLGAGKTTFTQALARTLGVQMSVNSPTFVLIQRYLTGRIPVVHCDFYRLGVEDSVRLEPELTDVLNDGQSLIIAEWAELADFLQPAITHHLTFDLDPAGETRTLKMAVMKNEPLKSFTKGS